MRRFWIGLVVLTLPMMGAIGVLLLRDSGEAGTGTHARSTLLASRSSEIRSRDAAWNQQRREAAFLKQYEQLRRQAQTVALTDAEATFLRQYEQLRQQARVVVPASSNEAAFLKQYEELRRQASAR